MRHPFWVLLLMSCASNPKPSGIIQLEHERHASSYALRTKSRDARPEIRRQAARAMGRIQSWDYLSELIRLTRDADASVAAESVFALGQLGFAVPPSEQALTQAIQALPPTPAGFEALGKLGSHKPDAVLETLLKQTKHPDAAIRRQIIFALFRAYAAAKQRPEPVARALIEGMSDDQPEVRSAAVYAVTRAKEPRAIPALMRASKDENLWVRLFAVRALGKTEDAGVAGPLLECSHDPDPMVRLEAVNALAAVKQGKQVPADLFSDVSVHVRVAAIQAHSPLTTELFLSLWSDPSVSVRCAAVVALGAAYKNNRLPDEIRALAQDADWRIRSAVARTSHSEDLDILRQSLNDADERVRASALQSIGKIDTDDAWALITASLSSDKLSVRATAVEIVAERKKPNAAGALMSCYRASLSREWIEVRESIVDALARLDRNPESAAFFQEVLAKDAAPSVKAKASAALGLNRSVPRSAIDRPDLLSIRIPAGTRVILETDSGEIELELFADEAPVHAANFVTLVERGHYDGLLFHRIVPNFVIQGGDPRGDGWGDAGYNIADEINAIPFERGTLGMPKAGKDTGGCQIFITHVPTPHLDGRYTVFGRVIRGMEAVDAMQVGDRILRARVGGR